MKKIFLMSLSVVVLFFALNSVVKADEATPSSDQKLDQLIEQLHSAEYSFERRRAAESLGTDYKGNDKALDALLAAWDRDSWVKREIFHSIGLHENPRAYDRLKRILFLAYSPEYIDIYNFEKTQEISALFEALGKIHKREVAKDIFEYFHEQEDFLLDLSILGWEDVKSAAQNTLLGLAKEQLLSKEELEALYYSYKELLLAQSTVWSLSYNIKVDKFAQETATFFLTASSGNPEIATGVVDTLVNRWPWYWRDDLANGALASLPAVSVKGTLDDQGRFIGRLGQFVIVGDHGNTVCEVSVPVERLNELYALVGKKVVVTGTLQHIRGRSKLYPLINDSHAMFVELKGVSIAQ